MTKTNSPVPEMNHQSCCIGKNDRKKNINLILLSNIAADRTPKTDSVSYFVKLEEDDYDDEDG